LKPRLLILIMMVFFVVTGYLALTGYFDYSEMKRKLQSVIEVNNKLQEENRTIRSEIEALKKDKAAMEKAARERLGLVKEDEVIYRLPE